MTTLARIVSMAPAALVLASVALGGAGCSKSARVEPGRYLLSLETGPGTPAVDVAMDLERVSQTELRASIVNGEETLEIPVVERLGPELTLGFPHYDSELRLTFDKIGDERPRARGEWTKQRGSGPARMIARAVAAPWMTWSRRPALTPDPDLASRVAGRWAMDFDRSGDAVGEFEVDADGRAWGTVMTPTGDYRFLAGRFEKSAERPAHEVRQEADVVGTLELSTFDGAHAFVIAGNLQRNGRMWGVFYSGSWWAEAFTAARDEGASLPDAFDETAVVDAPALEGLVFKDLDGNERRLVDVLNERGGRARIVEIFGTWCPNCTDAARELARLEEEYADRGLTVLGLAFEITPDHERAARQVRRYQERHGIEWPVLIAGGSTDKGKATEAIRILDRVRSYPTTMFLNERNEIVAVHTGFSGPATGDAYESQRREYERLINQLLEGAL